MQKHICGTSRMAKRSRGMQMIKGLGSGQFSPRVIDGENWFRFNIYTYTDNRSIVMAAPLGLHG